MNGQEPPQNASTKRSQTTPAVMRMHGQTATSSKNTLNDDPSDAEGQYDFDAVKWELENVHDVYSSIASHFSATRYKPWPLVTNFLASLPPGSIGVDVGCGNGKYLHLRNILHPPRQDDVPRDCMTVGVDRSAELTELAQDMTLEKMASNTASSSAHGNGEAPSSSQLRANEVAVGDGLSSGFRSHAFDYAISIATIHHFSTRQRRKEAIQELIRLVKPVEGNGKEDSGNTTAAADGRGRFLVYVWALEQRGQERRKFDEDEDGGGGADGKAGAAHGRDVLVPWVLRNAPKTKQQRHGEQTKGDVTGNDCKKEEKVFQRYYHLFEETELESLVSEAVEDLPEPIRGTPSVQVIREDSGWERGNWWGVWKVTR